MKTHQKILSAAIASLLLAGATVPSIADDLEDELQDIQGQIDESRSSQESWQQVIEDVAVKLKAIQADLDAANARLGDVYKRQGSHHGGEKFQRFCEPTGTFETHHPV